MIGDSFTPTKEEAIAAVREQAEKIWEGCPTCHDGKIETEALGIWNHYERIPLEHVVEAIESAGALEWIEGLMGWRLIVENDDSYYLNPSPERQKALMLERKRAELARLEADEA